VGKELQLEGINDEFGIRNLFASLSLRISLQKGIGLLPAGTLPGKAPF